MYFFLTVKVSIHDFNETTKISFVLYGINILLKVKYYINCYFFFKVADQQAALFGVRCFQKYDVNCTMGTGSFLSINTGEKPSTSHYGMHYLLKHFSYLICECVFHFS